MHKKVNSSPNTSRGIIISRDGKFEVNKKVFLQRPKVRENIKAMMRSPILRKELEKNNRMENK